MEWKTRRRIGEMTLKININKAYDKVMAIGYVKNMMRKMGFHDK
jgi:hypothetical protein